MHNLVSPALPPRPRTIITGCTLHCVAGWQGGDLWDLGDVYIFNAVGEMQFEGSPFYSRGITLLDTLHQTYFERRNVYVFAKSAARLNEEAQDYLAGAPR